jgi:hypothetical protein
MRNSILLTLLFAGLNIISNAQDIFTLQIHSNQIAYDSKRNLLYATVNSSDLNYANSLIAIDPSKGKVIKDIFVGSEPTKFVFTSDSNFLFICFDDLAQVVKFNLNGFNIVQNIDLGTDSHFGYTAYGMSLATLPDNDSIFIVSIKSSQISPSYTGTRAYSNGKKLPKEIKQGLIDGLLSTGTDTIYGANYESTGYDFYTIKCDKDSGLSLIKDNNSLFLNNAQFENGLVFDNNGYVVNPSVPEQIGELPLNNKYGFQTYAAAPDFSKNKVFYSGANYNDYNIELYSYNRTTYSLIAHNSVPDIIPLSYSTPAVSQLIRFGNNGLATTLFDSYYFTTQNPLIVILNNTSFVDTIPPRDTTGILKLYLMDTLYIKITIIDSVHIFNNDTLVLHGRTSVNYAELVCKVSMYPNPVNDILNVNIKNPGLVPGYLIQLADINGIQLKTSPLNSTFIEFNMSSFASGIYFVKIMDKNGKVKSLNRIIKR